MIRTAPIRKSCEATHTSKHPYNINTESSYSFRQSRNLYSNWFSIPFAVEHSVRLTAHWLKQKPVQLLLLITSVPCILQIHVSALWYGIWDLMLISFYIFRNFNCLSVFAAWFELLWLLSAWLLVSGLMGCRLNERSSSLGDVVPQTLEKPCCLGFRSAMKYFEIQFFYCF